MIKAQIVADSRNAQGDRITTMIVTFPRFILAELNTHRMFSRNSASSRAIPFKKMVESVKNNPFIPMAWQKDHKGMQGKEYFTEEHDIKRLTASWLRARDAAVEQAKFLNEEGECTEEGLTKQLCNRLLEPFMWHTVLITATEWENFFYLRCPQYKDRYVEGKTQRSWKDITKSAFNKGANRDVVESIESTTILNKLRINEGGAEIHAMALAEAMWDAYNSSFPVPLAPGSWHIPFGKNIDYHLLGEITAQYYKDNPNEEIGIDKWTIKIATAMCARISYTVVGEEGKPSDYTKDIALHDRLASMGHWSPFEHCAKAMTDDEYYLLTTDEEKPLEDYSKDRLEEFNGHSGNFKGFIQYRKTFKNENKTK